MPSTRNTNCVNINKSDSIEMFFLKLVETERQNQSVIIRPSLKTVLIKNGVSMSGSFDNKTTIKNMPN